MSFLARSFFRFDASHFNVKWIAPLLLLFVFTQTAGLLHAEIHPFHEHTASCDVFDNLAHPIDASVAKAPVVAKAPTFTPHSVLVTSAETIQAFRLFESRAPPFA